MADDVRRSAVEAFGCPSRYERIYVQGVDDTGDESVRGRAFHAAALVYIYRLAAAQVASDHDEASAAFGQGIAITGLPDHLMHEVERLFFRWAERFELDLAAFLSAEELQRSGRRIFRPDLVYCRAGELEIWDFKTYYRGLTEAQARRELQLRWYLVEAVKAWPGFSTYRFTYEFVRLNYRVSLSFTPEQIATFEPGVQAAIDAVERAEATGEYPALPGSHCALCRLTCPVVDNPERLPVRFLTQDDANQAAGLILATEQRLRVLRKSLAGWCNQTGPLVLNGQAFAHRMATTERYPIDVVLDLLKRAYADPTIPTISAAAIKRADPMRALISRIGMSEELQKAATTVIKSKFSHAKAGELDDDQDEEDDDDR